MGSGGVNIFLQGLFVGYAYMAPIGVQNLFVLNTAFESTFKRSVLTSFIVSFFDVTLALFCFYAVGGIIERSLWLRASILLAGGLFIIVLGIQLLRSQETAKQEKMLVGGSVLKIIVTACVVTWFNPQAIIDGTLLLGAFRVSLLPEQQSAFMLGTVVASITWFLGISLIVRFFSKYITPHVYLWINRICGVVILFYGLKLIWQFIQLIES